MTITLLQQDIVWADTQANIMLASEAIRKAPKSDLYVLPEMWSTGFVTAPTPELTAGAPAALECMQQLADEMDAAVAGSVAVMAEDGTFRNRFYFVKPSSAGTDNIRFYDKHHLFTYGGEHHRYTAGNEAVIVEWRGVRFRLLVCYDLRFPIWARNAAEGPEAYDCLLYVASWPTPRVEAWRTLLLARAIENQCYVCGVNRVGNDPACQYCGGTAFVDPYGRATTCADSTVTAITEQIDMEALEAFRKKFPVLNDRD